MFTSMDDIAKEFHKATNAETESLFIQGRILLDAANQGWDIDQTCAYCGASVGRSKRTAYRRYATARTFPKSYPAKTWEYHAICADLVDYRQSDLDTILQQQKQAHEWLQRSITEQWGTRALKAAMKKAGHNTNANGIKVLLDGVEMTYAGDDGNGTFKFFTSKPLEIDVTYGESVQITVVKSVAEAVVES